MATKGDAPWRLFGSLLRPHRRLVVAYGMALALATAVPLGSALLLSRFVDLAVTGASTGRLAFVAGAFAALGLSGSFITILVVWRSTLLAWAITDTLRHELAGFVLGADLGFHRDHTRGELVSRADDDVTSMAMFLAQFVAKAISVVAIALGGVVVLTILRPELGLVLGVCLLIVLAVLYAMRNTSLDLAINDRRARSRVSGLIEERVSGAEEIAALGSGAHSLGRFATLAEAVVVAKKRVTRRQMRVNGTIRVLLGSTEAAMLGFGALAYSAGRVTLGNVFLGVRFATATRAPIEGLMWRLNEVQGATGSASRVLGLLAQRPTHPERTHDWPDTPAGIELDDVTLIYAEDEGAVLDRVSLVVHPGRSLGLVGRSGSGKTSLGRLVLRLLPATSGQVRLAGTDVRTIRDESLRQHVTGVPQEVQLFPGTVRENVSMFDPDISDARIIDALSAVGLGPWLDAQTAGLDAQLLGRLEVATGMSAGEAQLLSLARALVRNPTIVVLDEATSRIDPATQLTVRTAVARLLQGRTAIVIAHRLDTLSVCDDIAVLAGGRIVEFGNRRSLAADPSSRFAHLLRTGAMSAEASLDDVLDLVGDPS